MEKEVKQKRFRGKTKLLKVHARTLEQREEIKLNEFMQPISDKDHVVGQFSLFLGTLVRQHVRLIWISWPKVPNKDELWEMTKQKYIIPEEGRTWVMKTMRDSFRGRKNEIKTKHYIPYETDEERLQNRPSDVPLDDFKMLLGYWGDEKVKARAAQNAAARKKVVDTHTTGPKLFSQIRHNWRKAKNGQEPTLAEMFVVTRERKEGRKYKSQTEVMNYRIGKVQDMCASGVNSESVDEIVNTKSSFIGRHAAPRKGKEKDMVDNPSGLDDIKEELRSQIEEEMEAKMNQKMAWFIKRLQMNNPNLNLTLDDFGECMISSENENVSLDEGQD